jgi:penicillin-insensitive murein endopeptidase
MLCAGCIHAPNPNGPPVTGSVGLPHNGVLVNGDALPQKGPGYALFRPGTDVRFGVPRFTKFLSTSFKGLAAERPRTRFLVGDLSAPHGGRMLPRHASHRTGRDVDVLFPFVSLTGAPIESPGFLKVDADGLAEDEAGKRTLRFDVDRGWSFVRAALRGDNGHVQWIFCSRPVRARLLAYATSIGEDPVLLRHAALVLHEPTGAPHDDHFHVRTACTVDDAAGGCLPNGPHRGWEFGVATETPAEMPPVGPLVEALFVPLRTDDAAERAQ